MRAVLWTLTLCSAVLAAACGAQVTETPDPPEPVAVTVEMSSETGPPGESARDDVVYVCDCRPQCICTSAATAPRTCTCGEELRWAHVVKVEGDEALLCTCAEGCACTVDASDPSTCACGAETRRVPLQGTGLYYCNCGGSCTCNHVSAEPGTCGCGMELKTST